MAADQGGSTKKPYRNIVLGLPPEGPKPGTTDAEALHAAEAFLGDLRAELAEYDQANARAVEAAAARWAFWRKPSSPSVGTSEAVGLQPAGDGKFVERSRATRKEQFNRFMFKKRNPHRVPILLRWWVPYFGLAALGFVWTPDMWKLRALHYCDSKYAALRRRVHTEYWRWTMDPAEFALLMEQIEANIAKNKRVKSSDCPF